MANRNNVWAFFRMNGISLGSDGQTLPKCSTEVTWTWAILTEIGAIFGTHYPSRRNTKVVKKTENLLDRAVRGNSCCVSKTRTPRMNLSYRGLKTFAGGITSIPDRPDLHNEKWNSFKTVKLIDSLWMRKRKFDFCRKKQNRFYIYSLNTFNLSMFIIQNLPRVWLAKTQKNDKLQFFYLRWQRNQGCSPQLRAQDSLP